MPQYLSALIYIALGFAPGIFWLFYYLRQDAKPEPNLAILKTFCLGAFSVIPTVIIQLLILTWLNSGDNSTVTDIIDKGSTLSWSVLLILILIGPLTEELAKFSVIRWFIEKRCVSFDEPLDGMLYLIISALGFATAENILVLFQTPLVDIMPVFVARFAGATFLHTLSSAILGYFLARGIFETHKRTRLVFSGIILATLFHGIYNYLIIILNASISNQTIFLPSLLILGLILIIASIIIFIAFRKLKTEITACKL